MTTTRPSRAFRPSVCDSHAELDDRTNLGPMMGWWPNPFSLLPTSYITLTDKAGTSYPVSNGAELLAGLRAIRDAGQTIDDLSIKGHGGGTLIYLTNADTGDLLFTSELGNHILIGNENVDTLLKTITDGDSHIYLTGCDTGQLAQNISSIIGDNVLVTGQDLPRAVSIPFTPIALGWHVVYSNGQVWYSDAPADTDPTASGG